MSQRNKRSPDRTGREEETKMWVQNGKNRVTVAYDAADVCVGPYPPPPNDESCATRTDPPFETKWNKLIEQYHEYRTALEDALQEIENQMRELRSSHQQICTEVPPSTRLSESQHATNLDHDATGTANKPYGLENEMAKLEIANRDQPGLGEVDPGEEERREEERRARNIWRAFDRHSQPRHKSRRERRERKA